MSTEEQTRFLQQLAQDLNSKNLILPSFPDVVINIRTALEDPTCSSERLADVVSTDPVLVARLLMSANSAFHNRAGIEIVDLRLAISRLGFEVVRNTAITLAVEQIFAATDHKDLRDVIGDIWSSSLTQASLCFAIARHSGKLNSDNAFLCGLLYQVGKLYILTRARDYPRLLGDRASLEQIMQQWNGNIGKSIVASWGFSEEISNSLEIEEHHDADEQAPATLTDVVLMSQSLLTNPAELNADERLRIAAGKLSLCSDSLPGVQEAAHQHAESMRSSIR